MNSKILMKPILFFLFLMHIIILPQEKKTNAAISSNQLVNPRFAKFNCNNISTFIYNNGFADFGDSIQESGFIYPIGTNKSLVYKSGLILGGIIKDEIRISGSMYRSGLLAGKILPNGNPDDPTLASVRPFRVRPDYKKGGLSIEVKDEGMDSVTIYNQYENDWNEWPAVSGAPFKDINQNGIYEPSIDIPGIPDAAQTIWFVANDSDPVTAQQFTGRIGLGIEMQTTVWGHKNDDFLDNIIFKKYRITNKNKDKDTIKNAYLGYWSDADIGADVSDDLIGCDTVLQIGYLYNWKDFDRLYTNESAAYGSMILSGPWDENKKNYMRMSSFSTVELTYGDVYGTPPTEQYFYNFLKGLDQYGRSIVDPTTNQITKFMYPGDPHFSTGWFCKFTYGKDYRSLISVGPFDLAYGESKDIVIAQIAATYTTRLEALKRVLGFGILTRTFYFQDLIWKIFTDVKDEKNDNIATQYSLFQNYPNPFNPSTTISYQLSEYSYVTLKIYDLLGREIATLVDEYKLPGIYEVKFNTHHFERSREIPSGIYFYSLKAGNYFETKKMVLMK